ncbi:MAG: hypothetical protein HYW86_05550 [Candidatus Roizmanbacteria bacterium]|nr:MAG: hypothetical protein HYW86_05550 [Candidatus Roizmanbacteria bacterium]
MDNINKDTIRKYIQTLKERGEADVTIKSKLSSIERFLNWAYKQHFIDLENFEQMKNEIDNVTMSNVKCQMSKMGEGAGQNPKDDSRFMIQDSGKLGVIASDPPTGGERGNPIKRLLQSLRSFAMTMKGRNDKESVRMTKISDQRSKIENRTSNIELGIQHYLGFAIFVIFMSALGVGLYNQFFKKVATPFAYPSSPTKGARTLSFQGRLTDSLGNPITTATNLSFRLYSTGTGATSPNLYSSGTCAITPDADGIFSTLIGQDCGSEIGSDVFTENANVYLGIMVGTDAEMTPRQQIANVGYAMNAETLQGLPVGTGTTVPFIPFVNSTGVLQIVAASPKIQSTSGTFTIEGVALSLTTPSGSNGNINLMPDGTGNVGIGTTAPGAKLQVNGTVKIVDGTQSSGYVLTSDANGLASWTDVSSSAGPWTLTGSNLYPDATTYNVAIGATNAGTAKLYVNGNVGIGTTSPLAKLEIGSGQIFVPNGSYAAPSYSFSNDPDTGIYLNGNDSGKISFSTQGAVTWEMTGDFFGSANAGGAYLTSATATSTTPSIAFRGDANTGLGFAGADILSLIAGGTNTMNITGGNVGIGTTNPGYKLEVAGDSSWIHLDGGNAGLYSDRGVTNDTSAVYFQTAGTTNYIVGVGAYTTGTRFDIGSASSSFLTIDTNGNVGIGNTNPQAMFVVGVGVTTPFQVTSTGDITRIKSITYSWPSAQASTAGSVLSNDATGGLSWTSNASVGPWTLSGSDLFPDLESYNVGIGTTTGAGTAKLAVMNGNVGIGTTNPNYILHLRKLVAGDLGPTLFLDNPGGAAGDKANIDFGSTPGPTTKARIQWNQVASGNAELYFMTDISGTLASRLMIKDGGNVGIGTTNPSSFKLEMAGNVGPSTSAAYDLGSDTRRWANVYANNLCLSGTCESTFADLGPWDLIDSNLFPDATTYNVAIGATNAGTAKLYVNGLVGLGTTAPTYGLTINSSSPALEFRYNETTAGWIGHASSLISGGGTTDMGVRAESGKNLLFGIGTAEKMRINSDGYVGIGTTNPSYQLEVVGLTAIKPYSATDARLIYLHANNGQTAIGLYDSNSQNRAYLWGTDLSGGGGSLILRDTGSNIMTYLSASDKSYITGGNLGIGTTNPFGMLQVGATNSPYVPALFVSTGGNIGIGTTNPTRQLTIGGSGQIKFSGDSDHYIYDEDENPRIYIKNAPLKLPMLFQLNLHLQVM